MEKTELNYEQFAQQEIEINKRIEANKIAELRKTKEVQNSEKRDNLNKNFEKSHPSANEIAELRKTKEVQNSEKRDNLNKNFEKSHPSANDIAEKRRLQTINLQERIETEKNKKHNIETINKSLEGKIHPETNVPFERKIIETYDGKNIEGVFPNFKESRVLEVNLPENMLQETDLKQFESCNEKLKESFDRGSINTEKFTERQLEQIQNGDKPEGFTWHHNEIKGRMELVNSDIHQATAHTGGKSIWGGGKENR